MAVRLRPALHPRQRLLRRPAPDRPGRPRRPHPHRHDVRLARASVPRPPARLPPPRCLPPACLHLRARPCHPPGRPRQRVRPGQHLPVQHLHRRARRPAAADPLAGHEGRTVMPDLRPILPLLGFLALMLGACDTAVSPLRDDPDAFFALHGYLDTGADTQYVRVQALRSTVAPETTAFLDATVHSLDEATGATRAWHDSLVTLEDGRPGHLFFAPFRPEPGRTYRLVVTRSDGARTEARITTPAPPRAARPCPSRMASPSPSP
ncbi:MAG: DUF4249 family protein [Bacteroidetes bacterium]|nr:MAG: DUF4249 family protein [Bacteroidota bacterium]